MKTKAGKIIAKVPDIELGRITEDQWAQKKDIFLPIPLTKVSKNDDANHCFFNKVVKLA